MRPLPSILAFLTRFQVASMSALVLAALSLTLLSWQSARTRRQVSAAQNVLVRIEQVQGDLIDLETGVRGYVITGDERFLEPYQDARGRILRDVRALGTRGPEVVPALRGAGTHQVEPLTVRWLALGEGEIVARRQDAARAATLVASGRSKAVMDDLRAHLARARSVTNDALTRRNDAAQAVTVTGITTSALVVAATFLIMLFGRRLNLGMRGLLVDATQAAEAFGAGETTARMPGSPYREGETLSAAFNGMAGHLNDAMAELQTSNTRLERSNRDLEQFAFAASHDLKTPLRTLISFSELLQRRLGPEADERTRRDLGFIEQAAGRMNTQVDALLHYARVQRGDLDLKPLHLGPLAREVAAERLIPEGETFTVSELPTVRGDPELLRQVFEQLFDNALRHGGRQIQLHATARGPWCTLRLSDDGPGIAPAYREQAFGLFQRVHAGGAREGSGVGLSLCRTVIERHGGRIWLEDGPGGVGLTVAFTLPLA